MATLLSLTLRRKRDVLYARQRLRQLTRLFRLPASDQIRLPTQLFAVAWQGLQNHAQVTLEIEHSPTLVQLFLQLGKDGVRKLWHEARPPADLPIAGEDLPWTVQECVQLLPPRLWDEVREQNDTLLRVLQELHAAQVRLAQLDNAKQVNAA